MTLYSDILDELTSIARLGVVLEASPHRLNLSTNAAKVMGVAPENVIQRLTYDAKPSGDGFIEIMPTWQQYAEELQSMSQGDLPHLDALKALADVPLTLNGVTCSFASVDDFVAELGEDALRYALLARKNNAPIVIDEKLAGEKDYKNPVFFVQYAHVQVCRLLEQIPLKTGGFDVNMTHSLSEEAQQLLRHLILWPKSVEHAQKIGMLHPVVTYVYDLANYFYSMVFNRNFPKARELPEQQEYVLILQATMRVLQGILGLMGLHTPSKM